MKTTLILTALFLASSAAIADDIAKPDCKQPIIPNIQASDVVVKMFEKKAKTYNECVTKFVDAQKLIEKNSTDQIQANMAHSAAESATADFNKFSEELKERNTHTPGNDAEE